MAAEFLKNDVQTVNPNQPVVLTTSIGCNKGYVYHRPESGIITLRGVVNCPNACFATYQATVNCNIAIPSTGTVGPISIALAIDGEGIPTSTAIAMPAAVAAEPPTDANFYNVTSTAIIRVPKGCCYNLSVENTSAGATPTDPAPSILVKNANLVVDRIA
ncbi:MAG: hypothetical protein K6F53_10480 [Lachnospiraceae bacterium]|nr:hypothetical protein [Lachnospiraceae bacterium]